MSIDFDVVCLTCKKNAHLGQSMAGCISFGFGSTDLEGRATIGEFIFEHLGHDLRIMRDAPDDCVTVPYEAMALEPESLKQYKDFAAHKIAIVKPQQRVFLANSRHADEGINGTGFTVLEAVGDYSLRQKLVDIEMAPVMALAEEYRVDPKVNAAKVCLTGPALPG